MGNVNLSHPTLYYGGNHVSLLGLKLIRIGKRGPCLCEYIYSLQSRQNGLDEVSNHQILCCLLNRLFGHRSNKTSKPRVTGLCEGNSPVTGEFPAQGASNAENVSI